MYVGLILMAPFVIVILCMAILFAVEAFKEKDIGGLILLTGFLAVIGFCICADIQNKQNNEIQLGQTKISTNKIEAWQRADQQQKEQLKQRLLKGVKP